MMLLAKWNCCHKNDYLVFEQDIFVQFLLTAENEILLTISRNFVTKSKNRCLRMSDSGLNLKYNFCIFTNCKFYSRKWEWSYVILELVLIVITIINDHSQLVVYLYKLQDRDTFHYQNNLTMTNNRVKIQHFTI